MAAARVTEHVASIAENRPAVYNVGDGTFTEQRAELLAEDRMVKSRKIRWLSLAVFLLACAAGYSINGVRRAGPGEGQPRRS